ncbi:hypothetical protein E1B28_002714 [Marasmius oreades]|uniref:Uncharacterized protein n=1 Tax=Marasmius oreades TaxID=181124 RepID=A0A9P7RNA9_9AGAR|nr:uncharacterized protein E1B28_002714 [Marasmius oreades]KAG7086786.1 hypothetical protein E1B28_002714 [Marasmius oreades]
MIILPTHKRSVPTLVAVDSSAEYRNNSQLLDDFINMGAEISTLVPPQHDTHSGTDVYSASGLGSVGVSFEGIWSPAIFTN